MHQTNLFFNTLMFSNRNKFINWVIILSEFINLKNVLLTWKPIISKKI